MRRRWGFRGWAIVWAVLQFALPAAATVADALLERESGSTQLAHVESPSNGACRPVHPAECALCQFVSRSFTPTSAAPSWCDVLGVVEQAPIAERRHRALGGLARLSLARAPPLG